MKLMTKKTLKELSDLRANGEPRWNALQFRCLVSGLLIISATNLQYGGLWWHRKTSSFHCYVSVQYSRHGEGFVWLSPSIWNM